MGSAKWRLSEWRKRRRMEMLMCCWRNCKSKAKRRVKFYMKVIKIASPEEIMDSDRPEDACTLMNRRLDIRLFQIITGNTSGQQDRGKSNLAESM